LWKRGDEYTGGKKKTTGLPARNDSQKPNPTKSLSDSMVWRKGTEEGGGELEGERKRGTHGIENL